MTANVLAILDEWIRANDASRPRGGEKVRMDSDLELVRTRIAALVDAARPFNKFHKIPKGTKPSAEIVIRFTAAEYHELSEALRGVGQ